jgi:hypothetical protein
MLYLFGRLALSDSFYFNQDIHSDEQPEMPATHRLPDAAGRAARATSPGPQSHRGSAQPLASSPAAESAC